MAIPPWVSLTVAAIALLGVIINATITWRIAREKAESDQSLQERKAEQDEALAKLNNALDRQAKEEEIWQKLNDKNWDLLHVQILELDKLGRKAFEHFKRLATRGHDLEDDMLFEAVSAAIRDHQDFKTLVRDLHIRGKDYQRLEELHQYFIVILLDVARTKDERTAKRSVMSKHAEKLEESEKLFGELTAKFLQPSLPRKK
jgi:hypothetical protein